MLTGKYKQREKIHNSTKIFTTKRSIDIKHNVDYKFHNVTFVKQAKTFISYRRRLCYKYNYEKRSLADVTMYYNGSFTLTDTKTKEDSDKCTNVVTACTIDIQSQYGDSVLELPQDSVCVCV